MRDALKVALVVGSLRRESFNLKLALALKGLCEPQMKLELRLVEIGNLPLYNEDSESETPPAWTQFRHEMAACQAVIFVTPEYNRSVPGCLKNALDVGSRPYGKSIWAKKPAAVISLSPGAMGAFGANHHLRQSLVFLDMPTLQQPEAYLGNASKLFGEQGELIVEGTREFLRRILVEFSHFAEKNRPES